MKISTFALLIVLALSASPCLSSDVYRINPGDVLDISIWGEENLHRQVRVLPDGTFSYPLIGTIATSRKSVVELQELLRDKLVNYLAEPEVQVSVTQTSGNVFYVIGNVVTPGMYEMSFKMNIIQALALAGGLSEFADKDEIKLIRKDNSIHVISYTKFSKGRDLESNVQLQSGDVIIVP